MKQNAYNSLLELAARESARERTISYLTEHMRPFIEPGEYALICFPGNEKDGLRDLMADAVSRCGGYPLLTGEDHRWKTMLRLAFSNRASTIIGTPLTVLGLSKLKKASSVPLFIHNAITAGYPCTDWMKDGIRKGFDCRLWCTAGIFLTDIVAGFSCAHGTHLREEYLAGAEDEQGRALPAGELGRLVLSLRAQPALRVRPGEFCRIEEARCPCGQPGPRLVDRRHWNSNDRELADIAERLLSWTSILDCSLIRGHYGLELELVVFPGEKLPKLPSCARLVVRPWNPETDCPFPDLPLGNNIPIFLDSH